MKNLKFRIGALFLSAAMLIGSAAACSNPSQKNDATNKTNSSANTNTAALTSQPTPANAIVSYPIKTEAVLKVWLDMPANAVTFASNLKDLPFGKQMEKETGIKVTYIHPAQGQKTDQFNIMIASGDIPDIIEYDWLGVYPGGFEGAAKNGLIIPLNDILPKWSPNLKKSLDADPLLNKLVKTDDGKYYMYPRIKNPLTQVWFGPMVREDWLKDLNLSLPETIDDWYTMLKAFKEKKGATSPLAVLYDSTGILGPIFRGAFYGAYKTDAGLFVDDSGKMQFGPITPGYKEFVQLMRKWYSEGLIDKDFPLATTAAPVDNLMTNNKSGALVGNLGAYMRKYLDAMRTKDPKFALVGAKYPVLKKGDKPYIGQYDFPYFSGYDSVITTKCKNVEIAARWLDYAYSEKGNMLFNFGIENESYTVKSNGDVAFTDLVNKNPEGLSAAQVQAKYIKVNGPFIDDKRYFIANLAYPSMQDAVTRWFDTDAAKHARPPLIYPTADASEAAKLQTDLLSYKNEMTTKFIIGAESMDNYDKFVEQLKKIGAERFVKINQDCLDRYNKR